jgi:LL-diaminopimelate aminotransferase
MAKRDSDGTIRAPRNENFSKLSAGYLFPVVAKKRREYAAAHPDKKVISLGVGDTTHPLPEVISKAMADFATGLGTAPGYSGYDPAITDDLKKLLAETFYSAAGVTADEVFVSDGSKCDLSRFQTLWNEKAKVAIPDPAYPAYVDDTVISGHTGEFNKEKMGYDGITYLPCTKENDFFPDITLAKDCDIMYFCNPNNPTGACASKAQLESLVKFCIENQILLVYDAAYAAYIRDADRPKTIFEIEGARKIAIETNSFSKLAGFTGVRLGWTVVPKDIKYGSGHTLRDDYNRVFGTHFNGAPNIAMAGGIAALKNMDVVMKVIEYYQENTRLIMETFKELGFKDIIGGRNSPYVFVNFPGKGSWDAFDEILEKCQVITTPGVGFGPAGEGFVRVSSYGTRENVVEACSRFKGAKLGSKL